MPLSVFTRARNGSATRWFAYAAAAIVITAAVGAHGLAWIARSSHAPGTAMLPLDRRTLQAQSAESPDMNVTGSIARREGSYRVPR